MRIIIKDISKKSQKLRFGKIIPKEPIEIDISEYFANSRNEKETLEELKKDIDIEVKCIEEIEKEIKEISKPYQKVNVNIKGKK